mmetsp:Transcript_100925/g.289713  ORF Transcript_100925/g.289713 Transcript_100925/m.289713 type:complete len:250 (+) Transcript_100925:318-1067(+)
MSAAEKYDSKYSMPRTQSEIMESRREASACLTNDDPPEEDNLMSGLVGLPGVFQLASEEEEGLLGLSAANPDEVDPRKTHSDRELRLSRMTCEIGEEELRDREEAFAAKVMEAAIAATTGDSDKASEWNEMHNPLRKSRLTVAETIVEESVMKVPNFSKMDSFVDRQNLFTDNFDCCPWPSAPRPPLALPRYFPHVAPALSVNLVWSGCQGRSPCGLDRRLGCGRRLGEPTRRGAVEAQRSTAHRNGRS